MYDTLIGFTSSIRCTEPHVVHISKRLMKVLSGKNSCPIWAMHVCVDNKYSW